MTGTCASDDRRVFKRHILGFWTMKRSKRLALSAVVLVISPVIGLLAAIGVALMIPGAPLGDGRFEATPVNFLVPQLAFVMVTGLCVLLGLRVVWDRRFD